MPGHIENIVDSSHDPEVSVLVAARAVAGQITSFEFAPELFLVAFLVAVNRAQHRRPRLPNDQFPTDICADFVSLFVHDRTTVAPHYFATPHPGLGIDRLPDRSQEAQRGKIMLHYPMVAPANDRPD